MILKKLSSILLAAAFVVFLASAMMSDNGRAGKTASPGEGDCTDCHSDYSLNSGGGSISISGISGGTYTPGTTYNMSITVSRTGSTVFGLGCEALTAANANAGTLTITNSTQTQLKNATVSSVSRVNVVHQLDGGYTSNTHTFNFNWTAPAAGTGNVTFYFAGIAGDHDGSEAGDYVYTGTLALTEGGCAAPGQPGTITGTASVCSGSSQTYSVAAVSGATDYIWSLPLGWTGASTTNSITVTAGSGSGTVSVAAHNSCGTSTPRTLTVTSSASVTPSVTIASGSGTSICTGTSVTFTATPVNGGTPSYQWKVNGSNVGTNSATYTTTALANNDVVTCVMTSTASCATASTATSNSITMSVSSSVTPSVTIASGSGTTICSGTAVTFTATPVNGGTPSYQWKVNGSNVGTNSATYSSSSLANNDVVTCVMTSTAACASSSTATSNSVTMTVNASVTPSVSIATVSGTSICSGTSVTFTATPLNGGSPSYQWKVNGSNVGTNSASYTTTALANNDVVTCVMTSTANCTTSSTATSNSITMTVNSSVAPAVSIAASPASTICAGTNVTFTATPSNGGASPSYQWKLNGSNVGSNSATYSNASLANSDVVSCVMTSNASCVSTSTATSNDVTITITNSVTPAVSIAASATAVCSGTQVTFTATPTNGGTTPSYQWTVNGSNAGSNSSTFTSSTLSTGDVVACTMTSNAGCLSTPTAGSNSISMTVNSSVTPTISITATPGNVICSGTSVTFDASVSNEGTTPSYQWLVNGVASGTNSNTFTSTSLNDGDFVTCELTSNVACATSSNVVSNAITMSVSSSSAPSVSISATPGSTVCTGTNVTFIATPVNGGSAPVYQWTVNGSPVGTNSDNFSSASLADGDQIQCTMSSNSTCATSSTASSQIITMSIVNNFTPSINAGGATSFCQGGSVDLAATAGDSYLWSPGGETTQTITVTSSGSYSVQVTSGSCSGSSSVVAVTVNPLPSVTLSAFTPVCSTDNSFTLTGGSPAGGVYSGNGVSNGSFDPSVAGVGTYTITYSYTDGNSCSASATSDITVNTCGSTGCTSAPDRPWFIHGPRFVFCGQLGVTYYVRPDTSADTYNWTLPPGANLVANNGNSIVVDFDPSFSGGDICVNASNDCGTSDDRCKTIRPGNFYFPWVSGNRYVCIDSLYAQYSLPDDFGATSVHWSASDGAIVTVNGNTASVDFTNVTSYFVIITIEAEDGCGDIHTLTFKVFIVRECEHHDGDHHDGDGDGDGDGDHGHDGGERLFVSGGLSLTMYPNPCTDGKLNLTVKSVSDNIAELHLTDLAGREIISQSVEVTRGVNRLSVNTANILPGIYILKLYVSGAGMISKEVMIQN